MMCSELGADLFRNIVLATIGLWFFAVLCVAIEEYMRKRKRNAAN